MSSAPAGWITSSRSPAQLGQWLITAFSTLGSGDPDGEHAWLLAGLFDAIMSTFRWDGA